MTHYPWNMIEFANAFCLNRNLAEGTPGFHFGNRIFNACLNGMAVQALI